MIARDAKARGCGGQSGRALTNYAINQPALDAAVVYYGTAPEDKDALAKITAPVMGFYGADDNRVTSTVEKTQARMKEISKSFVAHVYPGAGHGFLRQQTGRDGANEKAARAAWADTVAFLKAKLEVAASAPNPGPAVSPSNPPARP